MPAGQDPDSLIRRDGKEEFEKRLALARDFFDYWIDHEVAIVDLSSLGAKMQLVRKMADVIGRVNNASIRKEVIYKISARLGLSPSDLENLLPKPGRGQTPEVPRDMDSSVPVQVIKQLCVLALRDPDSRKFLLSQKWREVLAETPGAELLARILNADIDVENPATLNAFLASLEPHEEAMLAEWIAPKRIAYTDRNIAHQWWFSIEAEGVKRKLETLNNQMRMSELNTGDLVSLQKQILDLREQLHEISQLSSAPGAER
jgi:DNA primase